MEKRDKGKDNKGKARAGLKMPALALLLVLLIAAALFLLSDAAFIKSARDALMSKLGYVSEEAVEDADADSEPLTDVHGPEVAGPASDDTNIADAGYLDEKNLPEYDGNHYVEINGGEPDFPEEVYAKAGLIREGSKWKTDGNLLGTVNPDKVVPYEFYLPLDNLGRCQMAYGCLGRETMPEEGAERGDISSIHPSGWAKGQSWERCHLIAWSLSAENANEGNLITGTHYLNYDGMRPFEEETSSYIWRTGNHVLYMTEPLYKGDELVARGVHMVARSVEDNGEGLSFNIYCFNVTPGAGIDYKTGIVTTEEQATQDARMYVVNTRSKVFHYPSCDGAKSMSKWNREEVTATRSELLEKGYTPCGSCEP